MIGGCKHAGTTRGTTLRQLQTASGFCFRLYFVAWTAFDFDALVAVYVRCSDAKPLLWSFSPDLSSCHGDACFLPLLVFFSFFFFVVLAYRKSPSARHPHTRRQSVRQSVCLSVSQSISHSVSVTRPRTAGVRARGEWVAVDSALIGVSTVGRGRLHVPQHATNHYPNHGRVVRSSLFNPHLGDAVKEAAAKQLEPTAEPAAAATPTAAAAAVDDNDGYPPGACEFRLYNEEPWSLEQLRDELGAVPSTDETWATLPLLRPDPNGEFITRREFLQDHGVRL